MRYRYNTTIIIMPDMGRRIVLAGLLLTCVFSRRRDSHADSFVGATATGSNPAADSTNTCKNGGASGSECPSEKHSTSSSTSSSLKCNIDVVSFSDMSPALFKSDYYLQKPVLVTDVPMNESASKLWNTDYLLENYGSFSVGVGSSRTITKMGGTGRANARLGDVVEALRTNLDHGGDVDVYAFDRDSPLFEEAPEFLESIKYLAANVFGEEYVLADQELNAATTGSGTYKDRKLPGGQRYRASSKLSASEWSHYLSMGGKGSGVHMHHHGDGWSYSFSGEKHWYFHPPNSLPLITHVGFMRMRYWVEKGVYPKLEDDEKPLECSQREGDLMYIPEGWWHGTINEGSPITLSVASQRRVGVTDLERRLAAASDAKNKGKNNKSYKLLRRLLKDHPKNAEAWYILGIVSGRARKYHLDDELEAKQRAYELTRGRNCDVMNNLGSALVHHERYKEAESVLRDVMALCEWDDYAFSNLAATLFAQGKEEEAEKAFDEGKALSMKWNRPDMVSIGESQLML